MTIVEALHDEHELTVIDLDPSRLESSRTLRRLHRGGGRREPARIGGGRRGHGRPRDRMHLARRGQPRGGRFARIEAPKATTVIRASNIEYVELWREGQLDLDFIVSSELETAHAISRTIGVPAARQTDVFAEGQVQIVEFDVDPTVSEDPSASRCGRPRRPRGVEGGER